jgi:hypothetical protein
MAKHDRCPQHGEQQPGVLMTKKRSQSQRIGSLGESLFQTFCEQNYLIPNKPGQDFGFDFLCQIDLAENLAELGQIAGTIIGFSVRSTATRDGKIKLTRADVESLLAAEFPTGLALVKLHETDPCEIFFRLLDDNFTSELYAFVASKKKVKHFVPNDLLPGVKIREEVKRASVAGFVERSRLAATKQRTEPVIGAVHIEIRRDSDGQETLVTALDLYKYFEQKTDSDKLSLHLATFGAPRFRSQRLRDLALKERLMGNLARLPQPYVLSGFVMDEPVLAQVSSSDAAATIRLSRTGNERHFGYIHEAGFALTISTRKKQDGQYVHEMDALVDEVSDSNWTDHLDLLKFLDACRPDSKFVFQGGRKVVLDADYFTGLGNCSNFASALLRARSFKGFDHVPVLIRDMALEESRAAMAWLAAAASPGAHVIPRGLIFGHANESDCEARNAIIEVPVVCNLATATVVTWFSARGSILFHQGEPCGFKVEAYESREVETWEKVTKISTAPEIPLGPATLTLRDGVFATTSENAPYRQDIHLTWRLN